MPKIKELSILLVNNVGQGGDELPESLDWPGPAGDLDAEIRLGEDEVSHGLGARGDGDARTEGEHSLQLCRTVGDPSTAGGCNRHRVAGVQVT
jgi:hypothetical protein